MPDADKDDSLTAYDLARLVEEARAERDQAEAYNRTLRGAVLFALARGKFNPKDAVSIKTALNNGTPVDA